jgi:hypothetical protein
MEALFAQPLTLAQWLDRWVSGNLYQPTLVRRRHYLPLLLAVAPDLKARGPLNPLRGMPGRLSGS